MEKNSNKSPVVDMSKYDEEILSPEEYLKLSPEQRRDILKTTPLVKKFGSTSLNDTSFVSLHVKWKMPKYRVRL